MDETRLERSMKTIADLSGRDGDLFPVGPGGIDVGEAQCDVGELLTGGGLSPSGAFDRNCHVVESAPDSFDDRTWIVRVSCPAPGTRGNFVAFARCLSVT